jgi:stage V sporulation protein AC
MDQFDAGQRRSEQQHIEKVYNAYILQKMPKTKLLRGCFRAFWVGGLICAIGQAFIQFGTDQLGMKAVEAGSFAAICLVVIAAVLTGLGIFDTIGKYAGAGSTVPITGFSNGIVAPAMEHKREGLILGVGANLFKIAGPVIVCGLSASVIYGIIYFILARLI